MSEAPGARLWAMRLAFVGLVAMIVFFQLLPLQTQPRAFTGPDLVLAFTFAWAIRRPDYVPPLQLAILLLLCDVLLQRPPGLWAALVFLATERLKLHSTGLRDAGFATECLRVALSVLGVLFGLSVGPCGVLCGFAADWPFGCPGHCHNCGISRCGICDDHLVWCAPSRSRRS